MKGSWAQQELALNFGNQSLYALANGCLNLSKLISLSKKHKVLLSLISVADRLSMILLSRPFFYIKNKKPDRLVQGQLYILKYNDLPHPWVLAILPNGEALGILAHTTKRCSSFTEKKLVAAAAKLVVVVVETQVLLVLLTAYGSAALGQLFFFHVVLIRKEDDSDLSSDESLDLDSPKKTRFAICRKTIPETEEQILSARIDNAPESTKKQGGFRAAISPWKLIKMSRQKAQLVEDEEGRKDKKKSEIMLVNKLERVNGNKG
ncbi:hypothetical protein Tco_0716354 [Tanacetum coccineum]